MLSICAFSKAQDSHHLLQRMYYTKADTGWLILMKENYSYDGQGRLVEMIALRNNGDVWSNHMKTVYQYPSMKSDTLRIETMYEGGDDLWDLPYRSIFLQDASGKESIVIMQENDPVTKQWITSRKGEFSYDKQKNQDRNVYFKFENGAWVPEDRVLIQKGSNGLAETEWFQMTENDQWVDHLRTVYHYYPDNKIDYTEIYNMKKTGNAIQVTPEAKHYYKYDNNKNVIEQRIMEPNGNEWVEKYLRVYVWGK